MVAHKQQKDPAAPTALTQRRAEPAPLRRVRVIASEGRHWIVRELPPRSLDRGFGSLVFVSDHAMRRVRDYPADWFDCSDADLLAVSRRR
jgi:hypothetical protein